MSITVNGTPEAWAKYSDTEHSSIYTRPSGSTKNPRLVIFKRKPPTRNGSDLGVATYEIKIVNGDVDADGVPRDRNTLVDLTFRDPQDNAATVLDDAIDVLQAIAADSTLIPNLILGLLPQAETL